MHAVEAVQAHVRRVIRVLYALRSGREPGMRPERPGGPSGHRHTEDAEAILAALVALIEPDAAQLRYEPKEAARRLHMLTFAGTHPMITYGQQPLTAPEIVSLLLDGIRAPGQPRRSHCPVERRPVVLIGLLRTHLRPYRRALAIVVALQLVATMASLYLPSLNADIIDNGVVTGDTGYILSHRRLDAGWSPSCRSPAR